METLRMLPLARAEIAGKAPTFLERLFAGKLQGDRKAIIGDELVQLVVLGGFPEAISRESERRRQDWTRSYLTSVLTRDLRDIADIEKLTELPKFIRLLAEYSGRLVNYSQFGSSIDVSHKTGQRYVGLLEQIFLVSTLQPWYTNALKRIVKTPKLHFLDSGLLATARGFSFERVKGDRESPGSGSHSVAGLSQMAGRGRVALFSCHLTGGLWPWLSDVARSFVHHWFQHFCSAA
jgi:predicted AAA+ superfamily ATPase